MIILNAGTTTVCPNNFDVFLNAYSPNGTCAWDVKWNCSDTSIERATGIGTDGTYLYLIGYIKSDIGAYNDLLLMKYTKNSTLLWYKTWGGAKDDHGYAIACGGTHLYILGDTTSYGQGYEDLLIMKTDLDGAGGVAPEAPAAVFVAPGIKSRGRKKNPR